MMGAMENIPIGPADNVVPLHAEAGEQEPAPQAAAEEDLSYEEALARDEAAPAPGPAPRIRPNERTVALLEQAFRLGLGLTVSAVDLVADRLRAKMPEPEEERPDGTEPAALLTGAALGLALQSADLARKALDAAAGAADPLASWLANPPLLRGTAEAATSVLRLFDGRWQAEEASTRRAAEAFTRELVPEAAAAILGQLDLTGIVREHVDLDAVVAGVDLDAVASRIDVDAVASRLDVDAVVARVDMEAVIARLDLAALAREVIDEIDLPEIIRESSGAMASETVQEVRLQGIDADRFVARVVDKVLGRRRGRDLDLREPPSDG